MCSRLQIYSFLLRIRHLKPPFFDIGSEKIILLSLSPLLLPRPLVFTYNPMRHECLGTSPSSSAPAVDNSKLMTLSLASVSNSRASSLDNSKLGISAWCQLANQ